MPPRIIISKEVLEDLYIRQRKTIKEVSETLDINPITVAKNMKENGIKSRDVNSENCLLTKLKVTDQQFHSMLKFKYEFQQLSINKLAREFDVSQNIIRKYLKKYKINLRNHKESNKVSNSREKNHKWKGGKRNHQGYVEIMIPDHPYANECGYVYEHRHVIEQHIGRFLESNEVVHHINEIKNDNRIENLQLLSNEEHVRLHSLERHKKKKKG
jgi:hypothetical protein